MNGEPRRRITESLKRAPGCNGGHRTTNSFVKSLQLKNNKKVAKKAIERVRCVNYTFRILFLGLNSDLLLIKGIRLNSA